MSVILGGVGAAHARAVHGRRVRRLVGAIAPLVEPGDRVADIGCGDGMLASALLEERPGVRITGYETMARPDAAIPMEVFDGERLPLDDGSVDAALLVDVLHHTDDPMTLLREAARVSRRAVILKDHRLGRPLAGVTLRFMDWVGNRPHGVTLTYNYWPESRWRRAWAELGLRVDRYETGFGLYPFPASLVFERGLHFVALLRKDGGGGG